MPIIKKTLKWVLIGNIVEVNKMKLYLNRYGIPIGVTYLSINNNLWSPLSHQQINNKLSVVTKYEQQVVKYISDTAGLNVKMPDLTKVCIN